MINRQLDLIKGLVNKDDIVFTPIEVAAQIIGWLNPKGLSLDPCKGDGAFYNNLPDPKDWCELNDSRDFFDYDKQVNWIIGNPPYSIFEKWLQHSFELAQNVAYILPTNKVFQRQLIMQMINDWGGIKSLVVYGSGSTVGFPFGFSVGMFHFQKKWGGQTEMVLKTNGELTPKPRLQSAYGPDVNYYGSYMKPGENE